MKNMVPINKTSRISGWILSTLVILFCLFDVFGKFTQPESVIRETVALGYPERVILPLGVILLICTLLYAIPKTALWGAVLLTGYLGGAVATHIRVENPLFTHTLSPVYIGILFWLGLYLRSRKLRRLLKLYNE